MQPVRILLSCPRHAAQTTREQGSDLVDHWCYITPEQSKGPRSIFDHTGAARGPGQFHTSVDFHTCVEYPIFMNAQELKKLLEKHGCKFETHRGGSGHLTVKRGDRKSQLPMHGSRKELGTGLVNKILKDLGLK